ncbi:macro domain-containing protein [Psychrobacter sp. N25K4-3-2]|uniref:macro domain-containing protein n=1 Tax=Psychrobacter sp. N25K4-3-2 TaxID=2785026 RepID=UPI00188C6C24|nr:macro domain-containing protein [Psychrobacter sp. N25K4-3-2]MBF4489808.1 macro domain-containing protein [Psychrobacter sp. N25K4-3-2]
MRGYSIRQKVTNANVDAIVNTAKLSLTSGSGVDGAIHKAAGSSVLKEFSALTDV